MSSPRIIIHLVGREPLPVYLASTHFKPIQETLIHYPESLKIAEKLQEVLPTDNVLLKQVPLNDPQALYETLENLIALYKDDTWINVTGTTKLMSITAFHFAASYNLPILYLDMKREKFHVFSNNKWNQIPVDSNVNMKDYLALYGYQIVQKHSNVSNAIYKYAEEISTLSREELFSLTGGIKDIQSKSSAKVVSILYDIKKKHPGFDYIKFFSGMWLEIYIYKKLKNLFSNAYYQIIIKDKESSVPREIDFLGLYRNRLFIVSAKSGRHCPSTNHLLELESLRRNLGGKFAHSALVLATYSKPSPKFIQFAKFIGVHVFDFSVLGKLDQHFRDWLISLLPHPPA